MHPAKEGFSALPFFDEFDLSTVDVLLISQYVRPLFYLLHIHVGNHTPPGGQSRMTTCEAFGSGSLLPGSVSNNTFVPCTYEISEKPNTIQRHAFISCPTVSSSFLRIRLFFRAALLHGYRSD
jgi:hypothetical protein